ncbi:MAG: aldo/keto reductase [Pseudomonadales bacterium]|jgi:1-deoxyxylulose-5-phosphate synthase|nr:aldo/keto reductase [Pseudomonadales bacterium]MDP4765580.1 aldo/keto reductase [Pseudomonadales bacterium]
MKYTRLGNTGLSVSRICLGMMTYGSKSWREWILEYDESLPILARAWDAGINFYDTADVYSNGASEEVLGRMMVDLTIDREDIVIATKCFNGTENRKRNRWGLSRKHIMAACDASLKRLGTDYIDLYQIHRFDPHTPIEETIDALSELVQVGKVRYLGASSMFAWQMAKYLYVAEARGAAKFVAMQNYYNLLYREEEREMIPLCQDQQIALIPWSPLARGYLTRSRNTLKDTVRANTDDFGKMLYKNPADLDIIDRNAEVAARLGVKPAQTALAWVLGQPGITAPIIGASKLDQLEDALTAVTLDLTTEDRKYLSAQYTPHAILGHT